MDIEKAKAFVEFFKDAGYDDETIHEVLESFIAGAPNKLSDEDAKSLLGLVGGEDEDEDEPKPEEKKDDDDEKEFAHALGVSDDSLGD